jgi:hypothetical protein
MAFMDPFWRREQWLMCHVGRECRQCACREPFRNFSTPGIWPRRGGACHLNALSVRDETARHG